MNHHDTCRPIWARGWGCELTPAGTQPPKLDWHVVPSMTTLLTARRGRLLLLDVQVPS